MNLYHTRGDGAIGRKKTKQELRDEREQERIRHYQKQRTVEMEANKPSVS